MRGSQPRESSVWSTSGQVTIHWRKLKGPWEISLSCDRLVDSTLFVSICVSLPLLVAACIRKLFRHMFWSEIGLEIEIQRLTEVSAYLNRLLLEEPALQQGSHACSVISSFLYI
ncbi:hypothetical protein Y032_0024g1037 [Ancylostoma ceylanicum]|uniref:Uncharacterized protein n=1 Tax=Ancylostoma ceylanicum TaxID=53326 RepID=A0A016UVV6_9BILA|nr:hypothetical protein Y032_0024g1037 [Ancylostoma ceylanicum]